MKDTFDKLKKHGNDIIQNFMTKHIKPYEGEDAEYVSNDEDYSDFLKNEDETDFVCNPYAVDDEIAEETSEVKKSNFGDVINETFDAIKSVFGKNADSTDDIDMESDMSNDNDAATDDIDNDILKKIFNKIKGFEKNDDNQRLDEVNKLLTEFKEKSEDNDRLNRASFAEISFTLEKMINDMKSSDILIASLTTSVNEISTRLSENDKNYEQMQAEFIELKNRFEELSADVAVVSENQKMSKNSILTLAGSFDLLSKRMTVGFVTLGIICAICVILQIVFNII